MKKQPRFPKIIRWFMYGVAGLAGIVLLFLVVIAFVRIPIDLTGYKGVVEYAATKALGRSVKIDGKIVLRTSLWPAYEMEDLYIGNPEGFQATDFAHLKKTRFQIGVVPLLTGKVHIVGFSAQGLSVNLEQGKDGAVSWYFGQREKTDRKEPPSTIKEPEEPGIKLVSDSVIIEKLLFEDISVSYQVLEMKKPATLNIKKFSGSGLPGKPFSLKIDGTFMKEPFTSDVSAGSLAELIEKSKSWMKIQTKIAGNTSTLEGSVDFSHVPFTLQGEASVSGDSLDSLNGLLEMDLPALKSYRVGGKMRMQDKMTNLSDLEVRVGQSQLKGEMTLDRSKSRPRVTIDLKAPLVQLNDFLIGGLSADKEKSRENNEKKDTGKPIKKLAEAAAKKDDKKDIQKAVPSKPVVTDKAPRALFSPEVLGMADVKINIHVEKVLSGKDDLGSGSLEATLKAGRMSVDPIKLNLPGGSLSLSMSLKPGQKTSDASVKVLVENFDFGVLARRAKPDTNMGGSLNLDMNLTASAKNLDELLENANGYIDFSGHPKNLQAGILDLWAVNVIAAVSTSVESKEKEGPSEINCIVSRSSIKNGTLSSDVFVIDTSRIRICATANVDFKKQHIDLKAAPTSKKPDVFSLATPVALNGQFSDFEAGIAPGGLVGTTIGFITSPVTILLRTLLIKPLPADGTDVCGMAIGPDNRRQKPPAGCRPPKEKKDEKKKATP